MTKVQLHFQLERPLDEASMTKLSNTSSIYGIFKIGVAPTLDNLTVEYDATRLRPAEVHSALSAAGIPVAPK